MLSSFSQHNAKALRAQAVAGTGGGRSGNAATHNPGRIAGTLESALRALRNQGLCRHRVDSRRLCAATIERNGRRLVSFASNDYLGLAGDDRLVQAVREAAERFGWGAGASPLVCGYGSPHRLLENRLAEFEGTEAALVFSTGYAANLGTIAALVEPGDAVFCDRLNHASIIDGCRLSGARLLVYPHRNMQRLTRLLERHRGYRRRLIASDSLFSMDGDLAPVTELAELAEHYDATLLLDEAHATGVFGPAGRGVAAAAGVEHRVPVRVGTLSKSVGSLGGFVCGSRTLIDWLVNRARPYVFSTALPPACCAAATAALELLRDQTPSPLVGQRRGGAPCPQPGTLLLRRAADLRDQLNRAALNTGSSQSQIIPVLVGSPERSLAFSAALEQRGWFVPAIRPPSVPRGTARLRISVTLAHTEEQLATLARDLVAVARTLDAVHP